MASLNKLHGLTLWNSFFHDSFFFLTNTSSLYPTHSIICKVHRRLVAQARGNGWSEIPGMVSNTWFPWFPGVWCHSIGSVSAIIMSCPPLVKSLSRAVNFKHIFNHKNQGGFSMHRKEGHRLEKGSRNKMETLNIPFNMVKLIITLWMGYQYTQSLPWYGCLS